MSDLRGTSEYRISELRASLEDRMSELERRDLGTEPGGTLEQRLLELGGVLEQRMMSELQGPLEHS